VARQTGRGIGPIVGNIKVFYRTRTYPRTGWRRRRRRRSRR